MADVLILGCGYTGERLGGRLLEAGHRVTGTTRDPARARRLESAGIRPLRLDVAVPEDLRLLEKEAPEVCFYLIPPVRGGTRNAVGDAGEAVEEVLRALRRAPLETFVYGSSTGVYGDRGGEWVDENVLPEPDSEAGRARLRVERAVLRGGWTWDARPRIGRIAGIYGPHRVLVDAIREGRYRLVEGMDTWTNRIHVDDLAAGLEAIWRRGENGRIYNLSDGNPHRASEFAGLVAELCGLELPVITEAEARERYPERRLARKLSSKRVPNRRLREELGVELRYPSFRQGVPASLREMGMEVPDGDPG